MLTPIDIQNHTLKTAVRGYSKKETDEFLEQILACLLYTSDAADEL